MAYIIIDRRKNDKGKSTGNRQRFLKRVKDQVRDAVKDNIKNGSIEDIANNKSKKIHIPGKGLSQPTFNHNKDGGVTDRVYPGNKEFNKRDRLNRPEEGGGAGGTKGSPDGEGEDEFTFHLTREEFLDLFFEDLELPDLVKKNIAKTEEFENRRAGFSVDGNPARMNIVRSMKQAKGRRLGLRSPKKRKIKELEEQIAALYTTLGLDAEAAQKAFWNKFLSHEQTDILDEIMTLEEELEIAKRKLAAVPFIDDMDLRYNRWEKVPIPSTQAVMFGIMDVSGSMGEWEKEMAKRFFMLMYLFLTRNYERVDIVWIRHHTMATEVDEDEFFHSKETGGTIVSSALELMSDIIKERYPINQWNIFGCQISDGDNWLDDNYRSSDIMKNSILPQSQYYAYVEVDQRRNGGDSDLWPHYEKLQNSFDNLELSVIHDVTEIYPIFRKLFERKGAIK